jgi:poly(beta-D-mannuronate) lyase
MPFRTVLAALAVFAAVAVAPSAASAGSMLALPFPVPDPDAAAKARACREPAPPPVVSLAVFSRYDQTDATKSTIDEEAEAAYQAAMEPVRAFAEAVTAAATKYVESSGRRGESAACVVSFLAAWAEADALADLSTRQSVLSTTRIIAGTAIAWRIVKDTPWVDARDRTRIDAWFARLSDDIRPHYSADGGRRLSDRQNHRYWAGFAMAAIGVATGDRSDLDWGVESYRIGVCQVRPDGVLPLELARGKRARDYHIHATAPLVMIAELAEANGIDAYGICDGAIHRLVAFDLAAIADPSAIEAMTGERQLKIPTRDGAVRGDRVAWLAPYLARFPEHRDAVTFPLPERMTSSNLGGNLAAYYAGG